MGGGVEDISGGDTAVTQSLDVLTCILGSVPTKRTLQPWLVQQSSCYVPFLSWGLQHRHTAGEERQMIMDAEVNTASEFVSPFPEVIHSRNRYT